MRTHTLNHYAVRFSVLTVRGTEREMKERDYWERTPDAIKRRVRRTWLHSEPRILSVKKIGSSGGWIG